MEGVELLGAVLIGILAGWIAQAIIGGRGNLLVSLIIGLIGALIGPVALNAFGIWQESGFVPSLVVSTIGAIILLFIVGILRRV